ncbi:MAG: hypothetical protein AB1646_05485 [Thermodesulfobacteriota bacterium]
MKGLLVAMGVFVAVSLSGGTCFAQQVDLSKLDMVAIKSVRVLKKENLVAQVTVVLKSNSEHKLRLKNADLKVIIDDKKNEKSKKPTLILGDAKIENLEIESAKDPQTPCIKDHEVNVDMGPAADQATQQRLVDLVNLMCDPSREISLTLKGRTTAGVAHPRGWVDKDNYSFELKWLPTIQREILLQ